VPGGLLSDERLQYLLSKLDLTDPSQEIEGSSLLTREETKMFEAFLASNNNSNAFIEWKPWWKSSQRPANIDIIEVVGGE